MLTSGDIIMNPTHLVCVTIGNKTQHINKCSEEHMVTNVMTMWKENDTAP